MLTDLPDDILMAIMQGGPTTCDGIPTIKVRVNIIPFGYPHTKGLSYSVTVFGPSGRRDRPAERPLKRLVPSIATDLLTAMNQDDWLIQSTKLSSRPYLVRSTWASPPKLDWEVLIEPKNPRQVDNVATQSRKTVLEYIAKALKSIGRTYGLHVRAGPVLETPFANQAIFNLCEGGKLAQASHRFRLKS